MGVGFIKNRTIKLSEWRQGRMREELLTSIRFVFAFGGVIGTSIVLDRPSAIIPLLLGIIASALAETDDTWRGRMAAQFLGLCSFAAMIFLVRLSFSFEHGLVKVLVPAAFVLTLLGAMADRYRAIASATLIMALYAAMAIDPAAPREIAREQNSLLLLGAAWYGLISVIWTAILPRFPVEQNLALLFETLGEYLQFKSKMLAPVGGVDFDELRLGLAFKNGSVVSAMNASKEAFVNRIGPREVPEALRASLHGYFVAQDMHERTSSSHEKYTLLAREYFHSDILFRCQRVLFLLGEQCVEVAEAIRGHETPPAHSALAFAVEEMKRAYTRVEADSDIGVGEDKSRARRALKAVVTNLATMAESMQSLFSIGSALPADFALQDTEPRKIREFVLRLRAQLNWRAPLMRHAIRLSFSLFVAYVVMLITGDSHGYWILLTVVFVCNPQYTATLTRLFERISGTLLGLVVGWVVLKLFPGELPQAGFIILAGVVFFRYRLKKYMWATAGITMLVLISFNQVGNGFGLIVPRLVDTLAGTLIAGFSVWAILPTWHAKQLNRLAVAVLRAHSCYLSEILMQYGKEGKHDHLAYRVARRDAHNADAAFSAALSAASKEPPKIRGNLEAARQFLLHSHTLLNYLSAMGAHRNAHLATADTIMAASQCLLAAVEEAALALSANRSLPIEFWGEKEKQAVAALNESSDDEPDFHRILRRQLVLAFQMLPSLRVAANALVK